MYVKNGTVTREASNVMQTSYGEKQVLTVTTDDREEVKIWFKPGRTPHCQLQNGAPVQVLFEPNSFGTISKKLLVDESAAQQQTHKPVPEKTMPHKQYYRNPAPPKQQADPDTITEYIDDTADLLCQCLEQVVDGVSIRTSELRKELGLDSDSEVDSTEVENHDEKLRKYQYYRGLSTEDVRAMAISVLIATQKKFGL